MLGVRLLSIPGGGLSQRQRGDTGPDLSDGVHQGPTFLLGLLSHEPVRPLTAYCSSEVAFCFQGPKEPYLISCSINILLKSQMAFSPKFTIIFREGLIITVIYMVYREFKNQHILQQ